MCGICGFVRFDPLAPVPEDRLRQMRDTLVHRGPDDAGLFVQGNVGLGHRRLSIIDLSSGHQPMANADGTVWITYNGEVYNFREVRAALEAGGYAFSTKSDTEVVLRAYEAYGEACVEHLRGMFAFAIWDSQRQKLLLARDRLGIKPLYYAVHDGTFLFASEIKAILAAGIIRPSLNEAILPEFLATRYISGEETFFRGVKKLLPGRTLSWSPAEGFRERRYWRLPIETNGSGCDLKEAAGEVRARLEAAVRSHLMSDVPLGLFLSGGIDSSGLAALMAPMVREPIRTFAVGFDEPGANELPYARLAARAVGAEHHEVVVSPGEFFDALPRLIWHEDEPIAFTSSVPLYFVSRLAREHVKVVLTGEGADELFLGYNRYRVTAWNDRLARVYETLLPATVRATVGRLMGELPPGIHRYAQRTFLALESGPRGLFYENFAVFPDGLRRLLLANGNGLGGRDPYAEGLRCYRDAAGGTLERMSHADLQTYLVELLMKQDQMSMAASVESRVPFLDHEFVQHVAGLSPRFKLRGWRTKAVLRAALHDRVPGPILRRRKMGFPVPVGRWLRGPFWPVVEDFVLGPRALRRGLFEPSVVRGLAEEHRAGLRDHGDRLWLLVNLETWQRIFLDGEDVASIRGAAGA
jgi:asparagine synthase (glutamine-hydrolysing)